MRTRLGTWIVAALVLVPSSLLAVNGAREGEPPVAPESCPILVVGENWSNSTDTPPRFYWNEGEPVFSTDCFYYESDREIRIDLTDAFCTGDRFRLYIDGNPVAETTPTSGAVCDAPGETQDPNVAFGNPQYSWGSFPGPAGSHSVTIEVIENPFDGGGAYIRALIPPPTQAIPTLGVAGLAALALALGGLAIALVRRRRTA